MNANLVNQKKYHSYTSQIRRWLVEYLFEWDSKKDKSNQRKHRISFSQAATVFTDPNQLSIFDEDHSDSEDRWVTLGLNNGGVLCVVVHMFISISDEQSKIRIISAREADKDEAGQYHEQMS